MLQAAWAMLLATTGTYGDLIDTVVFADWIFFGSTVAAVFVFRRRFPLRARPPGTFVSWGYPIVPALFVACAILVVISVIGANPLRSMAGAGLLATGVPAYLYWSRRRGGAPPVDAMNADDDARMREGGP
jgi:APA family basic amino acid/polyamine antiporter